MAPVTPPLSPRYPPIPSADPAWSPDPARRDRDPHDPTFDVEDTARAANAPADFFCPVSLELMRDPVTIPSTGQTFERRAIESWLSRGGRLCPTTGLPLDPAETFVPNDALRAAVLAWALEECPAVVDPETAAIRESPEARDARLALERADANAAAKRARHLATDRSPRASSIPIVEGNPTSPVPSRDEGDGDGEGDARLHPREPRDSDSDIDERTRRALGSSAAVRSSVDVHRVRRRRVRVQRGARQPSHLSASRRKSPSRRFQTEHDRRPRRRRSERPSSALRALRRFMARRSRRRRRDGVHLPLRARKPRQRVDDDVRARRRGSVGVRRRRRIRLRDDVPSLVVRRRRRVHVRVRGPRDVRGPRGRRGYPRGVLRARDGHSPRGGRLFYPREAFDLRRSSRSRRSSYSRVSRRITISSRRSRRFSSGSSSRFSSTNPNSARR